ncbi:MAG: inositol monophosphatase family protein [Xanthobacteraceae bacterium]
MPNDLDDRLTAACAIAREAGAVARKAFEHAPQSRARGFKGPQDYVLESDAEVERVIRKRLAGAFPKDSFFGQESGGDFGRDAWVAGAQVRGAGSGTLDIAYVADGRTDGYCELHINSWDALAGLLLVEEAGGWVNDFLADDGLRRGNAVIGCTPGLKDLMMEAMRRSAQR